MNGAQQNGWQTGPLARELFVLVELPSGAERLEPVVEWDAEGVTILLRSQRERLEPGVAVRRLRFFSQGRCTAEVAANVRDVSQVTLEDGRLAWRVGLRLQRDQQDKRSELGVDVYEQEQIVADAVSNLVIGRAAASLALPATDGSPQEVPARYAGITEGPPKLVVLSVKGRHRVLPEDGQACEITSEIFGTHLAISTVLQGRSGDALRFSWPSSIRVWRHRTGGRAKRLPSAVRAEFEAPFTRQRLERNVMDVSNRGLAFIAYPSDGIMLGVHLPELAVVLPKGVVKGRGIVRNVRYLERERLVVGVELLGLAKPEAALLEAFVLTCINPRVRRASVEDLAGLWGLYEEAGVFQRQSAALSPVMGRTEATRKSLLGRSRSLLVQMVATSQGELHGTAELVRSFSRTWTLQHVHARALSRLTADQLLVPLIETCMQRQDCRFLHALLATQEQTTFGRLRSLPVDGEHLCWREWALLTALNEPGTTAGENEVQQADAADLEWIGGKLSERLTPLEVEVLDLHPAVMGLAAVASAYRRAALERRRLVRLAVGISGPTGFSLVEQSSPGLNLRGEADAVRLFATASGAPARGTALASLAADALRLQRAAHRHQVPVLVQPEDAPLLAERGFAVQGTCLEVVASETGARQLVNFVNLLDPL